MEYLCLLDDVERECGIKAYKRSIAAGKSARHEMDIGVDTLEPSALSIEHVPQSQLSTSALTTNVTFQMCLFVGK